FSLSPTPGEIGPSVIAGHVNYASVPGVFTRLHEMHPGDTITVDRADGTNAVFTTYDVDRYPKAAFPTDRVYGNTETPELRLITCGGGFDDAAGEYLDNVVVFAKLTSAYQQ
ncbi:MAG: sortase domain-containing protein, partial [Pseudonocardiaceae bacterium]